MESLSEKITLAINGYLNKNELEFQKMKLGIEIILINISKISVILLLSASLNLFKESLLMLLVFAIIRKSTFGIHAKSSLGCTIISIIMFVLVPYVSYHIKINNYIVFSIFVIINILLYKYAPADTENQPLIGKKLRSKLKNEAILTGIFLMLITLIVPYSVVKVLITLAAIFAVLTILPITYNLLKRRYKNYEKYERELVKQNW